LHILSPAAFVNITLQHHCFTNLSSQFVIILFSAKHRCNTRCRISSITVLVTMCCNLNQTETRSNLTAEHLTFCSRSQIWFRLRHIVTLCF